MREDRNALEWASACKSGNYAEAGDVGDLGEGNGEKLISVGSIAIIIALSPSNRSYVGTEADDVVEKLLAFWVL
jgi:hypothetical protein